MAWFMIAKFLKILDRLDETKIISYFLSLVFISAGISKILDIDVFRSVLISVDKSLEILTFPIVFSEIWIGVGLIFEGSRRISIIVGFIMLLIFTGFIFYEYLIGSTSECGCGVLFMRGKVNLFHLIQNFILIFLSLIVLVNLTKNKGRGLK